MVLRFLLATVFTPTIIFSQIDSTITILPQLGIVDTIIIAGNATTQDYVILDEMTLRQGSPATWEAIEYDKNRIYSLGLFTRVEIFYDTLASKGFLLVDVNERWYLIPVPLFGFRDGDTKRPFYGAGLLHSNFGGRNQRLFGSIVFGHNPSLALSFSDPQISRRHNLFFSGSLSYSRVRNRSKVASEASGNFDEIHHDINSTIGQRLSLHETISLNAGYKSVEVTENGPQRTVSAAGLDRFIYATVNYTYDSRNLREYASSGSFASLQTTKLGFGTSELDFTRFGVDARRYTPLPLDLTLVTRIHGSIVSGGVIPTYSRSYFGYGERIRGYYKTVFEGENITGANIELRFPILPPQVVRFSAIAIPQEFSIWRLGISLVAFSDAGATWFRDERLQLRSFSAGYGAGIDFLLPYSIIVRTLYAFNDRGRGQFILDVRPPL